MKGNILILVAFLSLPFFSFAQSNFKPGYVISLKGDTMKGVIDYQEWGKNPRQITFKDNAGTVEQYAPQNIGGFGVTGLEYYEAHIVKVSLDPMDFTRAGRVINDNFRTDTVFLRILNSGPVVSLFSYQDAIKNRYYILEHGSTEPQELDCHLYVDASEVINYVTRYKIQLQGIAQKNNINNDKLSGWIRSANYTEHDLLKIAVALNGGNVSQSIEKSNFGTRFFAGAGVSCTDLAFTGFIQYGDNYRLFPRVQAGIDFLTNKYTQRLVARLEIAATTDEHTFTNTSERTQLKVKQYTASFIPQVYYNFYSGQNFKAFAGGGLSLNISAYPVHYYTFQLGFEPAPLRKDNYPQYRSVWETAVLKAGILLSNHVEIYAGYSPWTTMTNDHADAAGNITSYQAGVNFLFGAK